MNTVVYATVISFCGIEARHFASQIDAADWLFAWQMSCLELCINVYYMCVCSQKASSWKLMSTFDRRPHSSVMTLSIQQTCDSHLSVASARYTHTTHTLYLRIHETQPISRLNETMPILSLSFSLSKKEILLKKKKGSSNENYAFIHIFGILCNRFA